MHARLAPTEASIPSNRCHEAVVGRRSHRHVHVTVVGEEQQEPGARRLRRHEYVAARRPLARVDRGAGEQGPLCAPVVQLESAEVSQPHAPLACQPPAVGVDQGSIGHFVVVVGRAERASRRREVDLRRIPRLHREDLRRVAPRERNIAREAAHATVRVATLLKRRELVADVHDLRNDAQIHLPRLPGVGRIPDDAVAHRIHPPLAVRLQRADGDVTERGAKRKRRRRPRRPCVVTDRENPNFWENGGCPSSPRTPAADHRARTRCCTGSFP